MPSVREIAEIANVSIGTVSRVLNNQPHVSEKARAKVLKAAKILRLNKLLRGSMLELYEDLMSSSATMRFTIKLTKLLVGMSFTLHYFACFW